MCAGVQRKTGFCTLCLLRDMVGTHWSGKQSYHPDLVHKNLYSEFPAHRSSPGLRGEADIKKGFNKNMQEDTHEFFRFVTDGLQTSALASHPRYDLPHPIPQRLKEV